MKEIKFSDPLYEAEISVLIGGFVPDLIKLVNDRHGDSPVLSWDEEFEWGEDAHTTNGYQFHVNAPLGNGERFYVWMYETTPSLLSHEIFHLTGDILFTRGIVYSRESEEAFAYLNGWLFEKVFNELNGNLYDNKN